MKVCHLPPHEPFVGHPKWVASPAHFHVLHKTQIAYLCIYTHVTVLLIASSPGSPPMMIPTKVEIAPKGETWGQGYNID